MPEIENFPESDEFAPYYARYIARVPKGDVIRTLGTQVNDTLAALRTLTEERSRFRYAPDKWSIREMLGHMIDAERIFAHRALTIARADPTPLPGFDENEYAKTSNADSRTLAELIEELQTVRHSTVALFKSFDAEMASRRGKANNVEVSVRALAFIIAGHERHHLEVLQTRYLSA